MHLNPAFTGVCTGRRLGVLQEPAMVVLLLLDFFTYAMTFSGWMPFFDAWVRACHGVVLPSQRLGYSTSSRRHVTFLYWLWDSMAFVCIPYLILLVQPFGDLGCECACGTVGSVSATFPCLLCFAFQCFTMPGPSSLAIWED